MRKYIAVLDDGHDYDEITYYSKYRNRSKKNLQDAKREVYLTRSHAKCWEIIDTYLA